MSKFKVIYDLDNFDVKKNEGGLYSILPYERLDKHKKALFKVGLADSYEHRFENYHTDYPLGFYIKNLLASPTKHKEEFKTHPLLNGGARPTLEEKEKAKKSTNIKYLKHIENYIFNNIQEHGGKRLRTTTRIRDANENGGISEWFYTDEKTLDKAFTDAKKEYAGRNYESHLKDINKNANQHARNATYKAEIYYNIV
jgi:hypothetical protein